MLELHHCQQCTIYCIVYEPSQSNLSYTYVHNVHLYNAPCRGSSSDKTLYSEIAIYSSTIIVGWSMFSPRKFIMRQGCMSLVYFPVERGSPELAIAWNLLFWELICNIIWCLCCVSKVGQELVFRLRWSHVSTLYICVIIIMAVGSKCRSIKVVRLSVNLFVCVDLSHSIKNIIFYRQADNDEQ